MSFSPRMISCPQILHAHLPVLSVGTPPQQGDEPQTRAMFQLKRRDNRTRCLRAEQLICITQKLVQFRLVLDATKCTNQLRPLCQCRRMSKKMSTGYYM